VTLAFQGRGTGGGCMVLVKPEPSTQGNQGASTPLVNTNPYVLTFKTLNSNPET